MPPPRSHHVCLFFSLSLLIFLVVFCGDGNGVPDPFFLLFSLYLHVVDVVVFSTF